MAWGLVKGAFGAVRKAAGTDAGKAVGGMAGGVIATHAKAEIKSRQERKSRAREESIAQREARDKALAMARDLRGGKYSERTIVADEYRYVVWVGAEPRAVFPKLTEDEKRGVPLAEHPDLRDFDHSRLKDPPPEDPAD